jgi:hypothetical protein
VEAEVERAHGGIGRAWWWWKRTRLVRTAGFEDPNPTPMCGLGGLRKYGYGPLGRWAASAKRRRRRLCRRWLPRSSGRVNSCFPVCLASVWVCRERPGAASHRKGE